jgi:hypothetical protein
MFFIPLGGTKCQVWFFINASYSISIAFSTLYLPKHLEQRKVQKLLCRHTLLCHRYKFLALNPMLQSGRRTRQRCCCRLDYRGTSRSWSGQICSRISSAGNIWRRRCRGDHLVRWGGCCPPSPWAPMLTADYRIKVHMDLQADKSPVVVKGPFFPRVVNPRYRIRGTMCNARIQSSKERKAILWRTKLHLI